MTRFVRFFVGKMTMSICNMDREAMCMKTKLLVMVGIFLSAAIIILFGNILSTDTRGEYFNFSKAEIQKAREAAKEKIDWNHVEKYEAAVVSGGEAYNTSKTVKEVRYRYVQDGAERVYNADQVLILLKMKRNLDDII